VAVLTLCQSTTTYLLGKREIVITHTHTVNNLQTLASEGSGGVLAVNDFVEIFFSLTSRLEKRNFTAVVLPRKILLATPWINSLLPPTGKNPSGTHVCKVTFRHSKSTEYVYETSHGFKTLLHDDVKCHIRTFSLIPTTESSLWWPLRRRALLSWDIGLSRCWQNAVTFLTHPDNLRQESATNQAKTVILQQR